MQTGLFGNVNYLEIPPAITGVKARVIGLVGKYFPTMIMAFNREIGSARI